MFVTTKNSKIEVVKGVQPVLPVQDNLIKVGLQSQLKDLFAIIFEKNPDTISEYELVDEYGYNLADLRKLLLVLARDNMVYNLRPGVWGVV